MMRWILSFIVAILMTGCATLTPQDYAKETPKLDLATYFNGRVDGWGMVRIAPAKCCDEWLLSSIASGMTTRAC